MRRRISALFACLLVLGFSLSGWSRVCATGAAGHTSHADAGAGGSGHHESSSHSGHETGDSVPPDDCQAGYSCTGLSLEIAELDDVPDRPVRGDVTRVTSSAPDAQFPKLEPPPPKA